MIGSGRVWRLGDRLGEVTTEEFDHIAVTLPAPLTQPPVAVITTPRGNCGQAADGGEQARLRVVVRVSLCAVLTPSTLLRMLAARRLRKLLVVELMGLEPTTPCLQSSRR
jgi:hypothetical protein